MIGLATSALAFLTAWAVARREPRHEPVLTALLVSLGYALGSQPWFQRTDDPEGVRKTLLFLWAAVAFFSGHAYQRSWSWKPAEGLMLLGTVAMLVTPALVTGRAHWWGLATWGPFVASSIAGGWGLLQWWATRERNDEDLSHWPPNPAISITQRIAVLLLASDVCMLLFVAIDAPQAQIWQGRVSAVVVAGVQIAWILIKRGRERREKVLELLRLNDPMPLTGRAICEGSDGLLRRGTIYVLLNRMENDGLIESRKYKNGTRLYRLKGHIDDGTV